MPTASEVRRQNRVGIGGVQALTRFSGLRSLGAAAKTKLFTNPVIGMKAPGAIGTLGTLGLALAPMGLSMGLASIFGKSKFRPIESSKNVLQTGLQNFLSDEFGVVGRNFFNAQGKGGNARRNRGVLGQIVTNLGHQPLLTNDIGGIIRSFISDKERETIKASATGTVFAPVPPPAPPELKPLTRHQFVQQMIQRTGRHPSGRNDKFRKEYGEYIRAFKGTTKPKIISPRGSKGQVSNPNFHRDLVVNRTLDTILRNMGGNPKSELSPSLQIFEDQLGLNQPSRSRELTGVGTATTSQQPNVGGVESEPTALTSVPLGNFQRKGSIPTPNRARNRFLRQG